MFKVLPFIVLAHYIVQSTIAAGSKSDSTRVSLPPASARVENQLLEKGQPMIGRYPQGNYAQAQLMPNFQPVANYYNHPYEQASRMISHQGHVQNNQLPHQPGHQQLQQFHQFCSLQALGYYKPPYRKELLLTNFRFCLTDYEASVLNAKPDGFQVYYFGQEVPTYQRQNHQWKYSVEQCKLLRQQKETLRAIALQPGDHYGFRFKILGVLGVGSFAIVYRIWDMTGFYKNELALKVSFSEYGNHLLDRELHYINMVHNAADVTVKPQSYTYIVKTAEGMKSPFRYNNMKAILYPLLGTSCRVINVSRWSSQLIQVLQVLESFGVVHNDIKPENVLFQLSSDGNQCDIVLNDFGMATSVEQTKAANKYIAGTEPFDAYEKSDKRAERPHYYGKLGYDFRADLFAVGLTVLDWQSGVQHYFWHHKLIGLSEKQARYQLAKFMQYHKPNQAGQTFYMDAAQFIVKCIRTRMSDRIQLDQALALPYLAGTK